MTALDFIVGWARAYPARPAHLRLVELADGSGDVRRCLTNTISTVVSLHRAVAAQADAIRGLREDVASLRGRLAEAERQRGGPYR